MPKLKWLEGYSGETTAQLIALEESHRIDSIILAFEQALDRKWVRLEGVGLTQGEWTVLAIEALEREVNNGGFEQFFTNPSRVFSDDIVEFLNAIDCPKTAAIAERAVEAIAQAPITENEINKGKWKENKARTKILNTCDAEYFKRPENIEASLFKFIKANRSDIRL